MNPRGFALIEIILAVSLSGLAVLIGALLWRQSLVAGTALLDHRVAVDREAGASRWLQSAIGSIDVGAEGDAPFTGHPDRVSFSTWLPTVNGWSERGTITLAADNGTLTAVPNAGESVALADGITAAAFDYLLDPGLNSQWASVWESPVSAPLAIRLRITRLDRSTDTMLFLVGGRG